MADRHIIEETTLIKSSMNIKVSFAVAIYNVAAYVEECVRSLFEQTLDEIEVILVDDCSTDGSLDIIMRVLKDYPNREPNVKVIRHERNEGISAGRKDGILSANGEYVIIIDGDDFVEPNMAELLYNKAKETEADITICDYYYFYQGEDHYMSMVPKGISDNGEEVREEIVNRRLYTYLWCKIIRRSLFVENDIVWPIKNLGEDTVLSAETVFFAKRISHLKMPLYHYRYNPTSVTKLLDEEHCLKNLDSFKSNVDILTGFLKREGVDEQYGRGIFINKMRTKNRLLPILKQRKYVRLWFHTYPEINKVILFGNKHYKSTYREKVWFFAILFGLYPKYKKRLHSKRFFPCSEWV